MVLNTLFFDSIFLGVLLGQFLYVHPYEGGSVGTLPWYHGLSWPSMVLTFFLSNLVVSGFVMLTLSGLVFFPLTAVVLAWRGTMWGIMLNQPTIAPLLLVIATFVLEGEGYVLASMAGTILGSSWLKPNWVYKDRHLSGLNALKTASKEALCLLFLCVVLLFLAAVVETLAITGT